MSGSRPPPRPHPARGTAGGGNRGREGESDAAARWTVVVASFRGPELLRDCLDGLAEARSGTGAHVIVARRAPAAPVRDLVGARPWATLVEADADADVPRLRGAGMLQAPRGWVAVTEDHCVAHPDWLDRFAEAAAASHQVQVLGGGMGNRRPGPVNWGAFFAEYGFFSAARPPQEGAGLVTGANVAYAPDVAPRVAGWAAAGWWEDVIHARLAGEGAGFRFVPDARVDQNATYGVRGFCADRYRHGYDYARVRLAESGSHRRWLRLLSAPLLPPLLTLRVARAAAGLSPSAFLSALPFTFLFLSAWAVGEAAGYARGPRS